MVDNFASRVGRTLLVSSVFGTAGLMLSGCGFVAGLFGIQFETYYSPEQREVFRTNVQIGLSKFGTDFLPQTSAEQRELDKAGIAICGLLRERPRSEVKDEFVRQLLADIPTPAIERVERFAEVFISASTAQGSLCSELR